MNPPVRFPTKLLFALPSLGLVVVALVAFSGFGARPVRSAEVYGGPTDDLETSHLRIFVQEEIGSVARAAADRSVAVVWKGPTSENERIVRTGWDGWVETEMRAPNGARSLDLVVRDVETGRVLVQGAPSLSTSRFREAARRGGALTGRSEGPFFVDARVREGVLAVPFRGHVELRFRRDGGPVTGTRVDVELDGAELISPARIELGESDKATIELIPREHVASIRLVLHGTGGADGSFYSGLPVVPGAFHVERIGREFHIESPVERRDVWYAFVSEGGRGPGGRLALAPTGRGGSRATLSLDRVLGPGDRSPCEGLGRAPSPCHLVLASSPDARSPSTVGYPLDGQNGTFDAVDGRLLDGAPLARRLEDERRARLRLALVIYVAAVFVVTLALFVREVRRADVEMRRRLGGVGAPVKVVAPASLGLGLAALCLVFGFTLCLVWVAWTDFGP